MPSVFRDFLHGFQQQNGYQGSPRLDYCCVLRVADERIDPQVCFNLLEEHFDVPALFAACRNCF